MRRALVTGGNSKFGKAFVRELKKSYHVTVIDREDLLSKDLDKYRGVYELVFFNHHYTPEEFDYTSFDMNCLVCLDVLDIVNYTEKVGWMVSSGVGAKIKPEYAPYFAYKSVNIHIMRHLTHTDNEIYFCIDPGHLPKNKYYKSYATQLVKTISGINEGGRVYMLNGSVSGL